jgi:RNA polymerase sigma-70 factor (ECF subfamily)
MAPARTEALARWMRGCSMMTDDAAAGTGRPGGTDLFLDDRAFAELTRRHQRELHVHCYRMLASFDEAEDAVQETFLRAWRHRESFDEDSMVRAWLYRVATNVCLDAIRSRKRKLTGPSSYADIPWLQPYPDRLLDEIAPSADEPDAIVVARETIELAFLAALQVLPARQRAVLVLRDVLGKTAAESAEILETSVAAANSALQRARVAMADHLPSGRLEWSTPAPSPEERELLDRFIEAHERLDAEAALAIASQDLRITMPPAPLCFDGQANIRPLLRSAFGPDREGDWRLVPTTGNRLPVAASYLRRPGDSVFRAFKLDALRIRDGEVAEITTFGWSFFPAFGLALTLTDTDRPYPVDGAGVATLPGELPSIGGPARRALAKVGIEHLGHVADRSAEELLALHGVGPEAVRRLAEALAANGLALRS